MKTLTSEQIVANFFETYTLIKIVEYKEGKRHEDYSSVTRHTFANYVKQLAKDGIISRRQIHSAKLG